MPRRRRQPDDLPVHIPPPSPFDSLFTPALIAELSNRTDDYAIVIVRHHNNGQRQIQVFGQPNNPPINLLEEALAKLRDSIT